VSDLDKAIAERAEIDGELEALRKEARVREQRSRMNRQIAMLRTALERAEAQVHLLLNVPGVSRDDATVARAPKSKRHTASDVLLCSDWHCGEFVPPGQTDNANHYTPEVFRRRVKRLVEAYRWRLETLRSREGYGWSIDHVVVALLGDLMTGHLHDDQVSSNTLTPIEEVNLLIDTIEAMLREILSHEGIARIDVPCTWGNHGRTEARSKRVATAYQFSYEWLAYTQIAKRFTGDKRIRFTIPTSSVAYLEIGPWTMRYTHGDAISYGGGVGGIFVPVSKWIARQEERRKAHTTVMGHWHDPQWIRTVVVNGSLIGDCEYARRFGLGLRAAAQVAMLCDAKRGFRLHDALEVQT
jgi:hypothetical protein